MSQTDSEFQGSYPSEILTKLDQELLYEDNDIRSIMENNDVHSLIENPPDLQNDDTFAIDEIKNLNEIMQFVPMNPTAPNLLSNDEMAGPYEFEVCIYPNGSKNPWVYSPALNKVFMDVQIPFPIDFKIKYRPQVQMFIRATPAFSLPQHFQECVYRCINHEHAKEATNRGLLPHVCQHVMRCNSAMAQYIGDREKQERLSILIPYSTPQTGTDSVREMFEFVCKTSCPSPGMNRRPIEVIFTLEDLQGTIHGRRVLRIRICSCPKRDKEKEEKELMEKSNGAPRGKKRKLEKTEKRPVHADLPDTRSYQINNLEVIGKNNMQLTLRYVHDLMAGEMVRNATTNPEPYRRCLNNIQALINKPPQE